jgi:hypothetical protein
LSFFKKMRSPICTDDCPTPNYGLSIDLAHHDVNGGIDRDEIR